MLGRSADPGHDCPEEGMKIALREADKNKTDSNTDVTDAEDWVARQDLSQRAGTKLQQSANGASHSGHDAEFAIAKVEIAQHEGKYQRLKGPLRMIDSVCQADEGQRGR